MNLEKKTSPQQENKRIRTSKGSFRVVKTEAPLDPHSPMQKGGWFLNNQLGQVITFYRDYAAAVEAKTGEKPEGIYFEAPGLGTVSVVGDAALALNIFSDTERFIPDDLVTGIRDKWTVGETLPTIRPTMAGRSITEFYGKKVVLTAEHAHNKAQTHFTLVERLQQGESYDVLGSELGLKEVGRLFFANELTEEEVKTVFDCITFGFAETIPLVIASKIPKTLIDYLAKHAPISKDKRKNRNTEKGNQLTQKLNSTLNSIDSVRNAVGEKMVSVQSSMTHMTSLEQRTTAIFEKVIESRKKALAAMETPTSECVLDTVILLAWSGDYDEQEGFTSKTTLEQKEKRRKLRTAKETLFALFAAVDTIRDAIGSQLKILAENKKWQGEVRQASIAFVEGKLAQGKAPIVELKDLENVQRGTPASLLIKHWGHLLAEHSSVPFDARKTADTTDLGASTLPKNTTMFIDMTKATQDQLAQGYQMDSLGAISNSLAFATGSPEACKGSTDASLSAISNLVIAHYVSEDFNLLNPEEVKYEVDSTARYVNMKIGFDFNEERLNLMRSYFNSSK